MVLLEAVREMKLQVIGVTKDFDQDKGRALRTLEDINLDVGDGEIVAILGPSGCGKTTLLRIIAGLERPTAGEVLLDQRKVERPDPRMGMVFQEHALLPWRTVAENVSIGWEIRGIPKQDAKERSFQYLQLVGLQDSFDRYPYELSGGMRQRASIARALTLEPVMLLMDEPFSALDPQTLKQIQEDIFRIQEKTGKAIIMVSHNIEEAVFLADRVIIIGGCPGKIKKVFKVNLARPRDRSAPEFLELKRNILDLLEELAKH
jgi:ABC-type nitrate/sulfonate/bicarbonate transport system ATPase subunit